MWLNKIRPLALRYFTKEGREGRKKEGREGRSKGRREGGALSI